MHPLRFPNSDIRAKRRQQGGGAANHGQPPCRAGHPRLGRGQGPLQGGGWLRPAAPAGAIATRGHGRLRPTSRGGGASRRGGRPAITQNRKEGLGYPLEKKMILPL
ncbi:hypothetical protein BHE74_00017012 [Ensete ventricosum]|nr:hypothetical protein GW17_00054001 [Ensete ventricosum]RWW74988.1 hypothetical protein BHE74_00017012 [Ensete ventricosum]